MDLASSPDGSPEAPIKLTTEDLAALDAARSWARFNYVVGVVLAIFISLGLLATVMGAVTGTVPVGFVLVAIYVVLLAFMVVSTTLLGRYTKGIAAHLAQDASGLVRAFRALKGWWICLVVVSGALGLATIVMILAELAGFKAGVAP